jgi:site-specific DNA-methyltransferase (adenine-specific)
MGDGMDDGMDDGACRLIEGDCLTVLADLSFNTIGAVVTDPPYGMGWDTDCTRFSGGDNHHRSVAPGRDWGESIRGDDRPFDPTPWLAFPKVTLWGANHFAARLPVGTTLVWVKRNEPAFGSFLSDAEIGWMKGGHGVYLHKDLSMNSLARRRVHPAQKPVGLMEWCIRRLKLKPGSIILDPYMGSGTTGVAALNLGYRFVGIESDATHFQTARKRLAAARSSLPLFARSPAGAP